MNRYLQCIVEADRIKQQKKEAARNWHEQNWSLERIASVLTHFNLIDNVARPTENRALLHISDLAYTIKRTGEMLDFDDAMWLVYFTDIELRIQWTNAVILPSDIATRIGYTETRVTAALRHLDNVMLAREKLDMRPLPPIPIRYLYMQKRVRRLADTRGVRIAA